MGYFFLNTQFAHPNSFVILMREPVKIYDTFLNKQWQLAVLTLE